MGKLNVVMYHYVRNLQNSRYPGIKGMDVCLFKKEIEFFRKNFNIVTMEDVIEAFVYGADLPLDAMLLTFDDGIIDNYTYAYPILKDNHIQGSFFIPGKTLKENKVLDVHKIHFILANADINKLVKAVFYELDVLRERGFDLDTNDNLYANYAIPNRFDDKDTIFVKRILQTAISEQARNIITAKLFDKFINVPEDVFSEELYMNYEQVKCMKSDGMFIGLHGYDHYWMGNLVEEEMKKDVDMALQVMAEFIDINQWVLNYPYGSYNDKVISYIKEKGCVLAMATEVAVADTRIHNRYAVPRMDCNDYPPKSNKYLEMKGL